jgi:hypothetical protein
MIPRDPNEEALARGRVSTPTVTASVSAPLPTT